MRHSRIYIDSALVPGSQLTLTKELAHYVAVVLRMKLEQSLSVFNGKGGCYSATISSIEKRSVNIEIEDFFADDSESPLQLTLAQAISRGQHMDYTIQKAVELGVSGIVPLFTEHSNVRLDEQRIEKRLQHWRKIIISACEQCGRNRLPELSRPMSLNDWLEHKQAPVKLVFEPDAKGSLKGLTLDTKEISLLSGPEGGFSANEIGLAYESGYQGIRLGPRVLRTETAAVAALAAIQTLWGDMGNGS